MEDRLKSFDRGISYSRNRQQERPTLPPISGSPSHNQSEKPIPPPRSSSHHPKTSQLIKARNIFDLKYSDFDTASSPHRHLKYGFLDEDDFEEFKEDLRSFSKLKDDLIDEFDLLNRRGNIRRSLSKTAESKRKSTSLFNPEPLMEFFNSDEHFQEFERVFETFKGKRISNNIDKFRWSLSKYDDDDDEDDDRDYSEKCDVFEDDVDEDDNHGGDMFSDFFGFDKDEDFKEFERELQNLKAKKRRSRVIERINRNSGCDIVQELKAFCDNDAMERQENRGSYKNVYNSGGEWDFIFNKLKHDRNSRSSYSDFSGSLRTCTSIKEDAIADFETPCIDNNFSAKNDNETCSNCSTLKDIPQSQNDCQFTCHQKCGPLVRLGCKAPPTLDEGVPPDPFSAETSLNEPCQSESNDTGTEATNEKDETDSGYRSGTIPDEKLPRKPSQATLNREELKRKMEEYNALLPGAEFALKEEQGNSESFQGFIKVVLNLVRPICMSLGARPPSIYEVLTREHIVEQNTMTISFYMPRDTMKSIHVDSATTAKEVISMLLKKFHILDHPRKFALYEQELSNKGKIVKLRRMPETECPLNTCLHWEKDKLLCTRLVLQENETGEIVWENFSLPELNNFLKVLDREENEYISQLEYKYRVMKKIVQQRLKEIRREKQAAKRKSASFDSQS